MTESTTTPAELGRWRDTAMSLCDQADKLAMAGFRRSVRIETKPDNSLVTEVDRHIERMVRSRINAEFPGAGIVGEEEGTEAEGASMCWYVDPIDGTSNFVRSRASCRLPWSARRLCASVGSRGGAGERGAGRIGSA